MQNKSHSEKITAIVTCRKILHDLTYMCLEGQKREHNKKEKKKKGRKGEELRHFPICLKRRQQPPEDRKVKESSLEQKKHGLTNILISAL